VGGSWSSRRPRVEGANLMCKHLLNTTMSQRSAPDLWPAGFDLQEGRSE
jgi:hypothetical protein